MKKYIIALIVFIISCSYFIYRNTGSPLIRIENVSDYDFDEVVLNSTNFGKVLKKESTEYKVFKNTYSYAYIKITYKDADYIMQPIDYVGECRLPRGKYTYSISFDPIKGKFDSISQIVRPHRKNMIDYLIINMRSIYNKNFGKMFGYL